jgi:hypothetical protein
VGGNGKRYSKKICSNYAKAVVPVLFEMWDEQKKLGASRPLTGRMIEDLLRLRADYGY